ncbi:GNAT family N-acetyltransferase [Nostoc sp. NIES-2111]
MNFEESWAIGNGATLKLRRIRSMDRSQLERLISQMSARDRRWRFHGAVNGLTSARLHSMVNPGPRTLAIVATVDDELVADVRCADDSTGAAAEFALMVAAGWRRRGVALHCIDAICRASASAGWQWLHGTVLNDNTPMLSLMRHAGFFCVPSRTDPEMHVVERRL